MHPVRLILLAASAALFGAAGAIAQPVAPLVVDGQSLDPALHALLLQEQAAARAAPAVPGDPGATAEGRAAARAAFDRRWASRTIASADMAWVRDLAATGRGGAIPVRVYRPSVEGPLPVIVYYHGGGWILGGLDGADGAVRLIANEARAIVVSVGYRLAPEHPYPAAWDDAEDAFAWVEGQAAAWGGDPARIAVGGDSAGGNLAVTTSLRRLAAGRRAPVAQLLYYPAVDMGRDYPSWRLFGEGFGLDRSFADYVMPRVFPAGNQGGPEGSPLHARAAGPVPPTVLAIAGFDILRDPADAYAARLARDGVRVTRLLYPGLTHGFLQLSGPVPEAARAAREPARRLGELVREVARPAS
ncbi:MAG TPA: alpha/beta hydrolase [Allosphingosinicella sp.]|nr:alpha/beta hydrolase [Allosphingosinicella sp.]